MNARTLLLLGAALLSATCARAYDYIDNVPAWPDGNVTLELQLGSSPIYSDGTTPNSTAIQAISAWNPYMKRVQLTYVNNSSAGKSKTNGKNNVFFSGNVYGSAFGDGVLAVTLGRATASGPIEMDVVVNNAESWDSYRGYLQYPKTDLRRVLAHEFGHVLGLAHPDEAGQYVNALMNAYVSDVDTTVQDDQDGVAARYGRGTANPAVAPVVNSNPYSSTVVEGQDVYFYASFTGTEPIRYQWLKDSTEIPGATSTTLLLPAVRAAAAGKYSLKATNEAGSATSSQATLTVNLAQAPVFSYHPQSTSVEMGGTLTLSAYATSNTMVSYQWTHDDVAIPGATYSSLTINGVTMADAGEYRVVATTPGGTATSYAATVTVTPTQPPVFQSHPNDTSVVVGQTAYLYGYASSSVPLTYQWMHDGVAVQYGTSNYLYINNAKASDAGNYQLVATNAAGSATSDTAVVTVQPLPPPTPTSLYNISTTVGGYFSFYASSYNWGTTTYKWYHDGVAIPNATGATYTVSAATYADAGEYFVVVSNASGSATSNVAILTVTGTNSVPNGGWKQALNGAGVAYFLFENPPRIERFDLASETWLAPLTFTRTPAVMAIVDQNTAVVAFYRTLARINLSTGEETALLTLDSDPLEMSVHNDRLYVVAADASYYGYRKLGSISLTTPTPPVWSGGSYYIGSGLSIDHTHAKAFTLSTGISPSDIAAATLNADGSIGTVVDSPYHGVFATGTKTYVDPADERVFDNAGTAYSTTDLKFAGTLNGSYDSLVFGDDGAPVILRGRSVVAFSPSLSETGRLSLGKDANHLAAAGDALFLFSQPAGAGSTITWVKRLTSELVAPAALPKIDPLALDYSVEYVQITTDGTILLFSRLYGNIFRWSTTEQRYLESIPLVGHPNVVAYSPTDDRVYTGYADGRVRYVDLAVGAGETFFTTVAGRIAALCPAGNYVMISNYSGSSSWTTLGTYDVDGRLVASKEVYSEGRGPVWNAPRLRIYDLESGYLTYNEIRGDGSFGTTRQVYSSDSTLTLPICISPSGEVVLLGNGRFFNADTLTQNNQLPGSIQDAAWLGTTLYTARDVLAGAELTRWGGNNYGQDADCVLQGRILRLLACGEDRLAAVTQNGGRIAFTLLDKDLKVKIHFENEPDLTKTRLANLSTRSRVGTGDNIMIAGFVVSGTQAKRVLIRAVGPTLGTVGVTGELIDPELRIVSSSGITVGQNDDWGSDGADDLRQAFSQAGAFSLPDGSRDAAMLLQLPPGPYTALVSGKSAGQGIALVETYDLDATPGERHLINISTRAVVGVGDNVMIPGLVIEGTTAKRLLIRAVGPGMESSGLTGLLADPQFRLVNLAGQTLLSNDDWGQDNPDMTTAAAAAAGAFPLTAGSKDAALVATVDPGVYTVIVSGVGNTTGIALVEIYEVP